MGLCASVNTYVYLRGKQNTRNRKTELEEKEGRIEGKRKGGRKGERERKIDQRLKDMA